MEAILRSGKKIRGRLAKVLVRKGRATPLEFNPEPEKKPAAKVKKTKKPAAKKVKK